MQDAGTGVSRARENGVTVVYQDPAVVGPGTHVLVIGIGDYPHLPGGGSPNKTPNDDGMRQLSSPPVSARHWCDWVISKFHNPDKQLATVELLLADPGHAYTPPLRTASGPGDAPANHVIERANVAEIALAAARWKARGSAAPGSLLIFYFCGHGISSGADYALVAADYGSNPPGKPFYGLIHFTNFLIGMSDCLTTQQIFFVDACRSSSEALVAAKNYTGDDLVQSAGNTTKGLQQCVYYSTLGGEPAHARPNRPSIFTDALVRAFDGPGAANSRGDWRINTVRLLEAIGHFMDEMLDLEAPSVQVPQSGTQTRYDIHYLPGEPEVPVIIPIDGHIGDGPPATLLSLAINKDAKTVACYPQAEPPHPSVFTWERRHFVSWLKTGTYEVAVVKDNGSASTPCVLQTPGQTVTGF